MFELVVDVCAEFELSLELFLIDGTFSTRDDCGADLAAFLEGGALPGVCDGVGQVLQWRVGFVVFFFCLQF